MDPTTIYNHLPMRTCVVVVALLASRHAMACSSCIDDEFDDQDLEVGEYGVDTLQSIRLFANRPQDAQQSLVAAKYNPGRLADRFNELHVLPFLSDDSKPQPISNITPAWQPEYLTQARSAGFANFDCAFAVSSRLACIHSPPTDRKNAFYAGELYDRSVYLCIGEWFMEMRGTGASHVHNATTVKTHSRPRYSI